MVAAQSPRLLYSATLGNSSDDPRNPNGVVAALHMKGVLNSINDNDSRQSDPAGWVYATNVGRNPVGVGELGAVFSQGSRVQQPWAGGRIPFGEMSRL